MEEYRIYTMPSELHKATNMLKGIISGIEADGIIVDSEMQELTHWVSLHANLINRSPFSELIPMIETALADGVIDQEEKEDILWVCHNFSECSPFYDRITSNVQYICGIVQGMLSDKILSDAEIQSLKDWLNANDFLKGSYPFDEIFSIVTSILADKKVTEEERNILTAFISNLIEFKDSYNLMEPDFEKLRQEYSVGGICAICPDVEIEGKGFCITGGSYRCSRDEFKELIESRGGLFKTGVSRKTDYLVVGNAGNPCWAYACYGRKIEKAIELRKIGCPIQIINETDLWDAFDD